MRTLAGGQLVSIKPEHRQLLEQCTGGCYGLQTMCEARGRGEPRPHAERSSSAEKAVSQGDP